MDYLVKITNSETGKEVTFHLETNKELNEKDASKIKNVSKRLFDEFENKPFSKTELSQLLVEEAKAQDLEASKKYRSAIRKIEKEKLFPSLHKSKKEIYQKLIQTQDFLPLRFFWAVFIAPFVALYRYRMQDRHLLEKLHQITGTKLENQEDLVDQLKSMKTRFQEGSIEKNGSTPLLNCFEEMISAGEEVLQIGKLKFQKGDNNLHLKAKEMGEKLLIKDGQEKDGFLGIIPAMLTVQENPTPLFFSFRKEGDQIYMEIQGLPSGETKLSSTYTFEAQKARESIPLVLESILSRASSENELQKGIDLSKREKIRLKNLELKGLNPLPASLEKLSIRERGDWLHEMFCNYGVPVEVNESKQHRLGQDPFILVLQGLEEAFPHADPLDKLEWTLLSFEEEYQALMSVIDRLSLNDQIYFLERVEKMSQDLQRYFHPIALQEPLDLFKNFSERLNQIKKYKAKLREQIQLSQKERLEEKIEKGAEIKLQVIFPEKKIAIPKSQEVKVITPSTPLESIEELKKSIQANRPEEVLSKLNDLHNEADRWIEKGEYLKAKELALQTLEVLPIPSHFNDTFWQGVRDVKLNSDLSLGIADLVKDIWECSLRLNAAKPDPREVIQLMKAQTINIQIIRNLNLEEFGPYTLDFSELENIIYLHPHFRFGWKGSQYQELNEIISFINSEKGIGRIAVRADTEIGSSDHRIFSSIKEPRRGREYNAHDAIIDFARMQMMLSCLMKPDYCLTPFFALNMAQASKGVLWQEGLIEKAKAEGAQTPEEIKKNIKAIRLRDVVEKLQKMKRLELKRDLFITQNDCFTIFDPTSTEKKSSIAYLPNGYGFFNIEYEERYGLVNSEANTAPLVGKVRGEARFLGENDFSNLANNQGLRDALSPQTTYTEPTLYIDNIKRTPKGQISQGDNYLIEATQIGKDQVLGGSVLEALNLVFNKRNLSEVEVQRTILLLLSRPFLIEKAIADSPREMEGIIKELKRVIQEKKSDPNLFPFLLHIGQLIRDNGAELDEDLRLEIPCFDNQVQVDGETKKGREWLEEFIKNRAIDRSHAAIAYLYAVAGRPLEEITDEMLPFLLFSATLFRNVANTKTLPSLNQIADQWISKNLLPSIAERFKGNSDFSEKVIKSWMAFTFSREELGEAPWKSSKDRPFLFENGQVRIDLLALEIRSSASGELLGKQKIPIPEEVRRSSDFLNLFGNGEIQAELSQGSNENEWVYSFPFGGLKHNYKVIYNTVNGSIEVYAQPTPKGPWFLYRSKFDSLGSSSVEKQMAKRGVWINENRRSEGYFLTAPLSQAKKRDFYEIEFNKKGIPKSIRSGKEHLLVAPLPPKEIETLCPLVNGEEALILLSPKGHIEEIRSLDRKGVFKRSNEGKWNYIDPSLGEAREWAFDLFEKEASNTQESRFLSTFGSDHQQFLLPLKQRDEVHYFIMPYPIKVSGKDLSWDKTHGALGPSETPISISFGKEGEIKASPSSLLYLAYYFCMKKDYERALFYLKKAEKMPAQSEQELATFEKIGALFEQIPYQSLTAIAFQLKAELTIRKILHTQFSQALYTKEKQTAFLSHAAHIASLYKQYCSKKEEKGSELLFPFQLKKEEEHELNKIEQVSFQAWLEEEEKKEVEKLGGASAKKAVPKEVFSNTLFSSEVIKKIPSSLSACLLLANFDNPPSLEKLLREKRSNSELLVRNFFHFYEYLRKGDLAETRLLNFLLAEADWELHPPASIEEKKFAELAQDIRLYLIAMCIFKSKGLPLQSIDKELLIQFKKQIPYWSREASFMPIRLFLNLIDLGSEKAIKLKTKFYGIQDFFAEQLRMNEKALEGKTIGELLGIQSRKDVETQVKGGVTPTTVIEYFQKASPDSYLPLEKELIPKALEEAEEETRKKKVEIPLLIQKFEAEGFPLLEIRDLAGHMREMSRVESELREVAQAPSFPIGDFFEMRLQKQLENEVKAFGELPLGENALRKNLEEKYETAKTYFLDADTDSEAIREEYRQISSGLEIAKNTLEDELKQKTVFSNLELSHFHTFLEKHLHPQEKDTDESLIKIYEKKRDAFLDKIRKTKPEELPKSVAKLIQKPDLYGPHDLMRALQKLYKDPRKNQWFLKNFGEFHLLMTEVLLLETAYQQFSQAEAELGKNNPAKALQYIQSALEFNRYKGKDPLIVQKCLVAEARAKIIYRPGQREIIEKITKDPNQWASLRMGLGKTSYAIPTLAEILAEQGKSVVITVPEKLLKSNRKDFDTATRLLFDQAGLEFSLPLAKDVPLNYLAEKALQIERIYKERGYIVTSVEELATLHDTCILLEDEKMRLHQKGEELKEEEAAQILQIETRLHYYRKIDRLLNGEATEINMPSAFFGDETDDTHHVSHEVSIASGAKVDPTKQVRQVARTILENVMYSPSSSPLSKLKEALLENTYPVMSEDEVSKHMGKIAESFLEEESFLKLLGEQKELLKHVNRQEWADYLIGKRDKLPTGLPAWNSNDPTLHEAQKIIGVAKQLLSLTFPSFLAQKAGNDLGLSDFEGFLVVPKVTKNETQGMRYGDEFEMVFAQYFGYLQFSPCESLTDQSSLFLAKAVKTLEEKSPGAFAALLKDYEKAKEKKDPSWTIVDYLKTPRAFIHRWNLLDDVVMDGGFTKRFTEQVQTNVQELFHKKNCGGVTGTLDPYSLPYISDEIQLGTNTDAKSSTREVEAETFLRLGLNVESGLEAEALTYQDKNPQKSIEEILKDPETTALINSSGATTEGLDTLAWISAIRKTEAGKKRSYLFMHPQFRISYFWGKEGKATPYKGQKLPEDTICIFLPSDVRGVDLPIRKGKVHMLVNPTASPQELVQSLYRARQLGGIHTLVMHIPDSLRGKIGSTSRKGKTTYGDVLIYLINRSTEMKLEVNLKAELLKIQFELKTALTRYLKEINPDLDRPEFFTEENLEKLFLQTKAQAAIFEKIRKFYIKVKEIDFESCYEPRRRITGIEKVLEEYDQLEKEIDLLLPELKEASQESFLYLNIGKDPETEKQKVEEQFNELLDAMDMAERQGNTSYSELAHNLETLMAKLALDPNALFDILCDTQLLFKETIEKIPEKDHDPKVLKLLKEMEHTITESTYGKGKSHLYNTIRQLQENLKQQKIHFEKQKELHKKFLPEKTTANRVGEGGSAEQVKEMQQQKTKEIEKLEDPLESSGRVKDIRNRQYSPLNPTDLLSRSKALSPLGNHPPFDKIRISNEAKALLNAVPMMTGIPLVYVTVDQEAGQNPQITVISKQDYHLMLRPQMHKDDFSRLTVYALAPNGFRWVNAGTRTSYESELAPSLNQELLPIKAFLGYREEFSPKNPAAVNWKNSLTNEEKKHIRDHVDKKGSPAQIKIFQELF